MTADTIAEIICYSTVGLIVLVSVCTICALAIISAVKDKQ